MPRKAGDSGTYDFVLLDKSSGKMDLSTKLKFPSVTTILHKTLAAPGVDKWNGMVTRDLICGAISVLREDPAFSEVDEDGFDFLDYLEDSQELDAWMRKNGLEPKAIMDQASSRGHRVHAMLEDLAEEFARGEQDAGVEEGRARAAEYLSRRKSFDTFEKALADWWLHARPIVVASEKVLVSVRAFYAGTCDLIWIDDSDGEEILTLTDLKTRAAGRGTYNSDHLQTGAYAIAWEEMTGMRIQRRSVLLAQDDGTFDCPESWVDPNAFLALKAVYDALEVRR